MKYLRAFLIGFVMFAAGGALATVNTLFGLLGNGPQDLSQLPASLDAQITRYIQFNNAAAPGEMVFGAGVCIKPTESICVIMPDGTARYIQTSATP